MLDPVRSLVKYPTEPDKITRYALVACYNMVLSGSAGLDGRDDGIT